MGLALLKATCLWKWTTEALPAAQQRKNSSLGARPTYVVEVIDCDRHLAAEEGGDLAHPVGGGGSGGLAGALERADDGRCAGGGVSVQAGHEAVVHAVAEESQALGVDHGIAANTHLAAQEEGVQRHMVENFGRTEDYDFS